MQSELEMAVAAVVTDWSGDRYVNGNNQSLTQYMTKARVESNMNTDDYVLAAFTLNTTNGVSVTYKNKGYNFTVTITDSGNSAKVTYEGEGEPAEVKEWIENEDGSVTDGEVTLQVGDYINYDPITGASRTSETSYATATGAENNQVFNLNSYTGKWKIFGVENGKIQIIPEDEIGPDSGGYEDGGKTYYTLYGATGLKNAVTELNKISELYAQGEYAESARSVNHQDVADAIGLTPEVWNNLYDMMEETQPGSSLMKCGNEVSIFWDGDEYPKYESTLGGNGNLGNNHSNGFYWYDFKTEIMQKIDYTTTPSDEPIITLTNDFYGCTGSDLLDTSSSKYKMVFTNSDGSNSNYWLGSRFSHVNPSNANFGVYDVYDGIVSGDYLVNSDIGERAWNAGVRPLVSLQSNIKLQYVNKMYNLFTTD